MPTTTRKGCTTRSAGAVMIACPFAAGVGREKTSQATLLAIKAKVAAMMADT